MHAGLVRPRELGFSLLAMIGLLANLSCGGDEPSGPDQSVAQVLVTPRNVSLAAGESVQLEYSVVDASGNILPDRTVAWASSAPSIATVSDAGVVAALAEGSVTITATSESKTGSTAVSVVSLVFRSVKTGFGHTCGTTTAGPVYCWGGNLYGQIGDGDTNDGARTTPVRVAGSVSLSDLSASGGEPFDVGGHTCGVTADGAAHCWGYNSFGQLGVGVVLGPESCLAEIPCSTTPVAVTGGVSFASVSAGTYHTCGLSMTGAAYCWGGQSGGELGIGAAGHRPTPTAVLGGITFAGVTAGHYASCGLTAEGAAYCWGRNTHGQLGTGTGNDASTPAPVAGGLSFTSISTAFYHTCAIASGGAAYCWGLNSDGQLGDGTTDERTIPALVAGGIAFVSISAGTYHTCGLTAEAGVHCWGRNVEGQLGDGTSTGQLTPVPVTGGLSFVAVSSGGFHSCAITDAGTVYCWGAASVLGDGKTVGSTAPVRVLGQRP